LFFSNLITALLVLDRLVVFSKLSYWDGWRRLAVGVVVAGAVVSLACNAAGSVYFLRAAAFYDDVAGTNITTPQHNATRAAATAAATQGTKIGAFQFGFEACMLPIVVVLFAIVGAASARRVKHAIITAGDSSIPLKNLKSRGAVEASLHLMRNIVGTCIVVFAGLLVRTVYAVMIAVAAGLMNPTADCDSYINRCSSCYNLYYHMLTWILYTPSFFFAVSLIGQPVVLLVALWGMTSGQMLAVMRDNIET
jgi:hypothetical protein